MVEFDFYPCLSIYLAHYIQRKNSGMRMTNKYLLNKHIDPILSQPKLRILLQDPMVDKISKHFLISRFYE